jgi:uncharacterized membrane protein YqhA
MILIGIASIFVGSLALLLFGAVKTYEMASALITSQGSRIAPEELMLKAVKLVDLFLLGSYNSVRRSGAEASKSLVD